MGKDGLRVLMEGGQSTFDCLLVVVHSSARLAPVEQASGQRGVTDFKVEQKRTRGDFSLKLNRLADLQPHWNAFK